MVRKPARDIDAHVRRLWRHRGTTLPVPRRGPRQQLDLDQLLDAAVAIADTEGLAAVSTRALAQRFEKTPMALYPYVGSKEQLLALMQDHASAPPDWTEPEAGLADALLAWTCALFDMYLAHPWLTERPWSQATQGPNEQDWLERLLHVLDRSGVDRAARPSAVTMLYATARACAQTAAAYRRMDQRGVDEWLDQARATREQIPDLDRRYPLWTQLTPHAPQWRDSPLAALTNSVALLATALTAGATSVGGRRPQTPTNRAT
jgi:AcrR family transcriptional regulator